MRMMNENELPEVHGGEINLDINKLIDQIDPLKWLYNFGHDVMYPYIFKPLLR